MIYITYTDLNDGGYIGIKKKIFNQLKVFAKYEKAVFFTQYVGQMLCLMQADGVLVEKKFALTRREINQQLLLWIEKYGIDKIYIRYALSDKWFVEFLAQLRDRKVKSVLEFPTFPYDGEVKKGRAKYEDNMYRKELKKYVDLTTTYSDKKEILGINCIRLQNGIGEDEFALRRERIDSKEIVFIAVASMAPWHGYERVIEGLHQYYQEGGEEQIRFKMVGNGPEIPYYRRLATEYGLESNVEFCGRLIGEELKKVYECADIAIGSLGMYKINLSMAAPIKLREYCAKGIPFVYGYNDIGFTGKEKYLIQVPNDKSSINIQKIVDFCFDIRQEEALIKEMQSYALKNFSWDSLLTPIIKYYQMR